MMRHDDKLKFAAHEYVGALSGDWIVQAVKDREFTVEGRCPVCHGEAFGPTASVKLPELFDKDEGLDRGHSFLTRSPGALRQASRPPAVVRMDCCCGGSHGDPSGRGCGAYWYVSVVQPGRRR
jgi:hypothetical protein